MLPPRPPPDLDDLWRDHVSTTQTAYLNAKADLEHAIHDSLEGRDLDILQTAHDRHDQCLQQYMHALRVFQDLVLDGVQPDKPPD